MCGFRLGEAATDSGMDFALWLLLGMTRANIVATPASAPDAVLEAQDPSVSPATSGRRVPAGTPVEIQLLDAVDSRGRRGDRFRIRLSAPLLDGGVVVVPAGAEGIGEITHAARAGMGGKPGELLLAARYLVINGRQVRLRAFHMGGSGSDRTNGALALAVGTGPFALFLHGGEIDIPAGAIGVAKLAEDFVVARSGAPHSDGNADLPPN